MAALPFVSAAQAQPPDPLFYNRGLAIYWQQCASCHGINGDGQGPDAQFQTTPPRNFLIGNFKFRSTGPGEAPAKDDIIRVIDRGIAGWQGESMPSFAHLPLADKFALAEVIRVFAELPEYASAHAVPPNLGTATFEDAQVLYGEMGCVDCHGMYGDGDGGLASALQDSDGRPIQPTNFTRGQFKGGNAAQDLWMRIYSGLDGTPMPAFGANLSDDQIWALVNYVQAFSNN